MKAAVVYQRSNVGSAIVAPQHRGASLALRPQVGELMPKMDYYKCFAVRKECFFSAGRWLWVLFLTVLLSSSRAYSDKNTQISEEGKCRYDLTSIAALSCMQPDGVWRPPSQTCCNALLYAIDQIPGSVEGGACCLCRYLKEKEGLFGLASTYILCNGKDKDIISKWPTFLISKCSAECTTISRVDMATSANVDVHGPDRDIWIAIVVFSIVALICFLYYWRSKVTINASEQQRISSREGEARARRRRSVIPSPSS